MLPRGMGVRMPAFSLYITDTRSAQLRAESTRLGISQSKLVWMALDQYFAKARPALAVIGADGVCWTDPMPLLDGERTYREAVKVHPQIALYALPHGTSAARGQAIPDGSEPLKVE